MQRSDSYYYNLSQRMRLLARHQDGVIDQQVEAPRQQLNELIDLMMDGFVLNDAQRRHIQFCEQIIELNQPAVKQLELQYAA